MNELLVEEARLAVSAHCAACKQQCCRRGMLNMSVAEAAAMSVKNQD